MAFELQLNLCGTMSGTSIIIVMTAAGLSSCYFNLHAHNKLVTLWVNCVKTSQTYPLAKGVAGYGS